MSKNNKLKKVVALVLTFILSMGLSMNTYAATTIERTEEQFTSTYGMYKSFNYTTGWGLWKKTHKAYFDATFKKGYIIQLKRITSVINWEGANDERQSLTFSISKSVNVSKSESWTNTVQVGGKLTILGQEIAPTLGGSYTEKTTYTREQIQSLACTLDRKSSAGYYALVSAVNADMFDVVVYEGGEKQGQGDLLKYAAKTPYIKLRYEKSQFD